MIPLFKRLLWEPSVFLAAVAAAGQIAVFWPDWRAMVTAGVTLVAGAAPGSLRTLKRG